VLADAEAVAVEAHARVVALSADLGVETERRADALAALRLAGWSLKEIADLLGVSKSRVAQIVGR